MDYELFQTWFNPVDNTFAGMVINPSFINKRVKMYLADEEQVVAIVIAVGLDAIMVLEEEQTLERIIPLGSVETIYVLEDVQIVGVNDAES